MKIGIFGGSFNPIHKGHMHLAESVMEDIKLDKIIFVPSKISPHKSSDEYISENDRLEMVRLSIMNNRNFEVSDYELAQDRVSYSVYTVRHFKEKYPDDELYLLVGTDMLLCFEKWYKFEEIMKLAAIVAVARENGEIDALNKKSKELSGYGKVIICKAEPFSVSSTEIRKKIVNNENWYCYLEKNVVQYIRLGGFYTIAPKTNS